ncbi:MAG: hypothetical protein WAO58_06640 [Fimbriimonadaceae bacterium]
MPKDDRLERHYTEKETAKIIRRAGELQARSSTSDAPSGISPAELFRIGQEVGLDAQYIREAMHGVEEDGDEVQTRWLGAPPSYEVERAFEGTLSDERWQALVGELNSTFQQSIVGVKAGPVHTWHWKHDLGSVHFTATQTPTSVRLKLVPHIDDGISVGMVSTIGIILVTAAAPWGAQELPIWAKVLASIFMALALGLWFRKIVAGWYRHDQIKMAKLMDRLEQTLQEQAELPLPHLQPAEEPLQQRLSQS